MEITGGKYTARSRSSDLFSISIIMSEEINIRQVLHPVCGDMGGLQPVLCPRLDPALFLKCDA